MKKTRLTRRDFLFSFRKSLLSDTSSPTSTINTQARRADKLLEQGDYNKAKEIYIELIKNRSDNLVARQKLAYCYYKLGETQKAKDEFLKLKKIGINSNFLSLYLGLCFAHEDNLEMAIESFKNFFDITKPIVQRAINLQIALFNSKMATKEDMINSIEEAIEEQNKMDN